MLSFFEVLRTLWRRYRYLSFIILLTIHLNTLNNLSLFTKKVLLVYAFAVLLSSCSMFNRIGENVGDGFGKGITPYVESMGEDAVKGVKTGIDNAEFDLLIDSLVSRLSDSLGVGVGVVREEIFGDATAQRVAGIRDTLIGDRTRSQLTLMVNEIMEELIGDRTRRELGAIRDELLGEALRANLMGIRDELTGPETEERLASLARAFVYEASRSYADTLRPLIREDIEYTALETKGILSWLRKNVQGIIFVFGAVVAGLIGLIWYFRRRNKKSNEKRERNERIVQILTREIDELRETNPSLYEEMTAQIQKQTVGENVEQDLREILGKQGML